MEPKDRKEHMPKRTSVWDTFADKVTITGIEDLHRARRPLLQLLFVVGLILATAFGVFTSFRIGQQLRHEMTPVAIKFGDDGEIPFPNVTICTTTVNNATAARELLVIPPEVERKLRSLGANRGQFINDTIQFTSTSSIPRNINQTYLKYIDAVITATARSMNGERSVIDIMRRTIPPCEKTLSTCTYNGKSFDCCQEVVIGAHDGFVCYGVPVSRANGGTVITRKPITFDVDVKMDWRHIPFIRGDDALDGFIVIIGQPYTTMNNAPVAVAPGWHGTIKLAQIKRRRDRKNCTETNHLPKLGYTSYYDEHGKLCELDILLESAYNAFQCTFMLGNYFPNSSIGCSFGQGYMSLLVLNGVLENAVTEDEIATLLQYVAALGNGSSAHVQSNDNDVVRKLRARMYSHRARLGSFAKRCKPVCDRWQYEPIVGYSELRSNKGPYDDNGDISWSRITVTIPSEYYEGHVEGPGTSLYVLMCNIGGTIGVCLGLSAVTLIQALVYGCYTGILYQKQKLQKTAKGKFTPCVSGVTT